PPERRLLGALDEAAGAFGIFFDVHRSNSPCLAHLPRPPCGTDGKRPKRCLGIKRSAHGMALIHVKCIWEHRAKRKGRDAPGLVDISVWRMRAYSAAVSWP